MTTVQVVETSVTVINNSPIQNCLHPDHYAQRLFKNNIARNVFYIVFYGEKLNTQ